MKVIRNYSSKEYRAWRGMRRRCYYKKEKSYSDYGGRGIDICSRWEDYEVFLKDMGYAPPNTSIDRIDNNKGYSPDNCRWGTISQQANNKRTSIILEFNGRKQTLKQWACELGINRQTLETRLEYGWSVDRTFQTPVKQDEKFTFNGESLTITEWERKMGFKLGLISKRIRKFGWSIERAVTTPTQIQYDHSSGRNGV